MNNYYMSLDEANAMNNLNPGDQLGRLGTRLKNALDRVNPGIPEKTWYVDGTYGNDSPNTGKGWDDAFATIGAAVAVAEKNATIFILAKEMAAGATDPVSYAETIIIPAANAGMALIGVSRGLTQGGLPQIKKGSGSTALLTIRAPGCLIANLCFNGGSSTGGGILLDDDGSTKSAFGTTIVGNYFKNCVGSTATDARTGGAIQWSSAGNAWQVLIKGNRFYKNVGDIVLLGTGGSVPQDIIIEDNTFSGPAANVDCNIYLAAGSGVNGVSIYRNVFTAFPAIGSGSVLRFMDITSCIGIVSNNMFADTDTSAGYGAARAKAKIPTTAFIVRNYSEGGLIARQ